MKSVMVILILRHYESGSGLKKADKNEVCSCELVVEIMYEQYVKEKKLSGCDVCYDVGKSRSPRGNIYISLRAVADCPDASDLFGL